MVQVLIVYSGYSVTGSTATLAAAIAGGAATRPGVRCVVKHAEDVVANDWVSADAVVLGSGVYNGNFEPAMGALIGAARAEAGGMMDLSSRVGGVFCTCAGVATGAQPTMGSLTRALMTFGAVIVGGGDWHNSEGLCGVVVDATHTKPLASSAQWEWAPGQPHLLDDAAEFGARIANVASLLGPALGTASGMSPTPASVIMCGHASGSTQSRAEDSLMRLGVHNLRVTVVLWAVSILTTVVLFIVLKPRRI
jgi:multimeric flavodoxin WrbA